MAVRPAPTHTCRPASPPSRPPTTCWHAASPCRERPPPSPPGGRTFDAGAFILRGDAKTVANGLASQYGLDVYALGGAPSGAVQLRRQRIAVCVSDSGALGLLKRFGFAYDVVTRNDLNDATKPPLTDYDVFINTVVSMTSTGSSSLNATGKAKLTAYVAAGKDYIGIGGTGASVPGQFGLFASHLEELPGHSGFRHPDRLRHRRPGRQRVRGTGLRLREQHADVLRPRGRRERSRQPSIHPTSSSRATGRAGSPAERPGSRS